jgi:NAD(P)-dependent dehydrogenase (short-subunit alcohol dehydrogenase family)
MGNRLNGKIAIITGATGGIGSAAAKRFVTEGAKVMLVDRDPEALSRLSAELSGSAVWQAADVSSETDTKRYVHAAVDQLGAVDILFANAGIEGKLCPLVELPLQVFQQVWSVNVQGVFLAIKHAAPWIAQRGGGSIVITSSIAALMGSQGLAAYVTSKHALTGLARTAALELAPLKIRVNTVNPGPIDNRMMRSIEEQAMPGEPASVRHGFESKVALGRYGTNDEIANMALFLASAESSYATGAVFVVDGGFTAA